MRDCVAPGLGLPRGTREERLSVFWGGVDVRWFLMLGSIFALATSTCIDRAPFECVEDQECRGPGAPGICAAPGYCAVEDLSCESGWSYGRFATPELVGRCTEPESGSSSGGGSSSEGSSSEGSSSSSSSSGDPLPVEECNGIDDDGDGLIDEWSALNEECDGCMLYQREGSAYWHCSNDNWTDMQMQCATYGANLASVQDSEENLWLALRTESGADWIGLNDIGNEGNYTWVDGMPVEYTNWTGGMQPSDSGSNCVGTNGQGEWLSFNCLNSRPGFCEAPHPDP